MDYKEKYERANKTLMEIITMLIVYHMTDDSEHCIKEIDRIMMPYALLKKAEFVIGRENKDAE